MLEKPYSVNLCLYENSEWNTNIHYISWDQESYPLYINLFDADAPHPIPSGALIEINFKNSGGLVFPRIADVIDAEQGKLLYNVDVSDIAVDGAMSATVSVISGTQRLTWIGFNFTVVRGFADEQAEPPEVDQPWRNAITSQLSDQEGRIIDLEEHGGGMPSLPPPAVYVQSSNGSILDIAFKEDAFQFLANNIWLSLQRGIDGVDGQDGKAGYNGWTPKFATIADGNRVVIQVIDWTGGGDEKPSLGYLSSSGIVPDIAMAVDIRGDKGEPGESIVGPPGQQGPPGSDSGEVADIGLFVPDEIYATVGNTLELYNDQVFRAINPGNYEVYYNCPVGRTYKRKWSYTPAAEHAPEQTVTVEIRGAAGTVIASKSVRIVITPVLTNISSSKLMLIGDSISTDSISPIMFSSIRDFAKSFITSSSDVIDMVGTQGTAPNNHEATSGAKIEYFLMNHSSNPFWDTVLNRTNFAAYSARTGIRPDFVHIMLGTNNLSNMDSGDTAAITQAASDFVQILRLLRQDWPDTFVLAALPPMLPDQDGLEVYRANQRGYRQSRTDKAYQRYAEICYSKIVDAFANDTNLIVVPHMQLMDRGFGYGTSTVNANPYTTDTIRISNGFNHPRDAGQKQIAANLVSAWARGKATSSASITITNMLANAIFDGPGRWDYYPAYYNVSTQDGVLTQTGKSGATKNNAPLMQIAVPFIEGHKIYVRVMSRGNFGDQSYFYARSIQLAGTAIPSTISTVKTTDWQFMSAIVVVTAAHVASPYFNSTNSFTAARDLSGIEAQHTQPMCIDLTTPFTLGNEPELEICDSWEFFAGSRTI